MLFKLFGAIATKHWKAATDNTPPPLRTPTPITDLTQRSAVEIGPVPLILAQGDGSLIKNIPGRHVVTAIGALAYMGHTFYRVYLSQGDGAFLHIATHASKPNEILELRLYQPYHEILPEWKDEATMAAAGIEVDAELCWSFWLLDNPDPMVGGLIGCPVMQGKMADINPATGIPFEYNRTWVAGTQRIVPVETTERLVDQGGGITDLRHRMMHYARPLKEGTNNNFEYLLVSAVETPDGASVNYWLGMDIKEADLTVYSPAAG